MAGRYIETYFTPEALAAQEQYYGRSQRPSPQPQRDLLTTEELEFISKRDSFYMATITSNGWPYVQHRGGPPGFLKSLDPQTLGFADFKGNRQLLSTGNLAASDRVALILIDYPQRERLKIIGHSRVLEARKHPDLVGRLMPSPELQNKIERLFLIDVVSFDWNCPQYITPRYTEQEIEDRIEPLKRRIVELEEKLRSKGA